MGSPICEWGRGRDGEPESDTRLSRDFWMKESEVLVGEWRALGVMPPVGSCKEPTCPVDNITWYEALSYANRLSAAEQRTSCYELLGCAGELGGGLSCQTVRETVPTYECDGYRLPTEAEWEYAARSGTRTATYAGDLTPGNEVTRTDCRADRTLNVIAWYCDNAKGAPHPAKQLERNHWGLYDMAGNAAEWTLDSFHGEGYAPGLRVDPVLQDFDDGQRLRVIRGGFAAGPAIFARSAYRFPTGRSTRAPGFGFRLARTAK